MKKELLAFIFLFTGITDFSQEIPYTNCTNGCVKLIVN
jgi:hypothetical protein